MTRVKKARIDGGCRSEQKQLVTRTVYLNVALWLVKYDEWSVYEKKQKNYLAFRGVFVVCCFGGCRLI
ncbi:MAG: hypothetical protein IJV87_06135 [Clostridia bacterium]|nr:hypothetical protein [Clostridia bacterium]